MPEASLERDQPELPRSFALTSSGWYAWGRNDGAYGNGTTNSVSTPGADWGLAGLTALATGAGDGNQELGLTASGLVEGWGGNSYGQTGDNSYSASFSPVSTSVEGCMCGISGICAERLRCSRAGHSSSGSG
jgi:hypothetical protein